MKFLAQGNNAGLWWGLNTRLPHFQSDVQLTVPQRPFVRFWFWFKLETISQTNWYVLNSQTNWYVLNSQTNWYVLNSQTNCYVSNSQTNWYVLNSQTNWYVLNTQTNWYALNSQTNCYVSNSQTNWYVLTLWGFNQQQLLIITNTMSPGVSPNWKGYPTSCTTKQISSVISLEIVQTFSIISICSSFKEKLGLLQYGNMDRQTRWYLSNTHYQNFVGGIIKFKYADWQITIGLDHMYNYAKTSLTVSNGCIN